MDPRGIAGKLAAVDCTKHQQISKRFEVKGFPTIKYFKDGAMAFDAGDAREEGGRGRSRKGRSDLGGLRTRTLEGHGSVEPSPCRLRLARGPGS